MTGATHRTRRYELEPFISSFAMFDEAAGLHVLRAVTLTPERATGHGIEAAVFMGDAENLALPDHAFDVVDSWGVLHRSRDTQAALHEVRRVLRPGGVATIMVYHRASIVGLLWARYAPARGRPRMRLDDIYATHLETPSTKAYSPNEVIAMLQEAGFSNVATSVQLSIGDLLQGAAGQRHQGVLLRLARRVWPTSIIRRFGPAPRLVPAGRGPLTICSRISRVC